PRARRGRGPPGRRARIARDAQRAIAERMDRNRKTRRGRARDVRPKLDRIEREDAAIVGSLVGLLERRGLRPERAVREELHMAEAQPFVALPRAHAARERGLEVEGGAVADLGRGSGGGERERERAV